MPQRERRQCPESDRVNTIELARMSKVHDELWEKSDAAKILIDTASRRAKDLSTSQLTYVDGIVALCHDHLIKAGWTNGAIPTVPFPKEQLTLHDPDEEVTDREANTVLERGFNTVKGLTSYVGRPMLLSGMPIWQLPALKGCITTHWAGMETHDALGGMDAPSSTSRYPIQLHW